jgi:hypothetical protein
MAYKTTYELLPRSILSVLHEPIVDPRDGHGARSVHDIMILRKWNAAKRGDGDELIDLIKHIVREDLTTLKSARKQRQICRIGGGPYKIRTLIPVMVRLGMIKVETIEVSPERDGHLMVNSRQRITLEPWFASHAFERDGVDPQAIDQAKTWLANGGIQRPRRGEGHD